MEILKQDNSSDKTAFDKCLSCKSDDFSKFKRWVITEYRFGYVLCRDCVTGKQPGVPDVYFNPKDGAIQTCDNIWDKKTNQPIPFYDKTSKAAAMKQAGVKEAGDAYHGTRNFRH